MAGPYYTADQWARDVLAGLGNKNPTQQQVDFLKGWNISEGGGYAPAQGVPSYNPINTSEPAPGSTCQNCALGYHVQNYPNYQTGLAAILKNLQGGYYPDIVAYLRGQPYNSAALVREFNMFICGTPDCRAYPYGTYGPAGLANRGAGTNRIIPGYRPPSTPSSLPAPNVPAHAIMHGPVRPGGGGTATAPADQRPIQQQIQSGLGNAGPQSESVTGTLNITPPANPVTPPAGPARIFPLYSQMQTSWLTGGRPLPGATNKSTGMPSTPPSSRGSTPPSKPSTITPKPTSPSPAPKPAAQSKPTAIQKAAQSGTQGAHPR